MNFSHFMITQRDKFSLSVAALAMVCIMALAQIQLPTVSDLTQPKIVIIIDALPPQEVESTPEHTRQPKATKPLERSSKPTSSENLATSSEGSTSHPSITPTRPVLAATQTPITQSEASRNDIEKEFEGKIRALIESSKRYPTGREASLQKPQGLVMACAVLNRSGSLQEIKIQNSSGYPILDNAAKRLLANLQYPNLPNDFFPGKEQHMFCVNLDYKVPA